MKIIAFLLVFTAFTLRTFALVSWRNLPRSNRLGSCFAKQSFAISRLENGKQPSSGIGDENGKQRPGPPAGETKRRPLKPKRNYSNGTNGDGKGDAQKPKRNYSNGTDSDGKGDAQKRRRASSQKPLTRNQILSSVEQSGSAKEINTWMQKLASNTLTKNESSPFQSWSVKDQNEFIRLLKGRGAYQAIVTFMEHLGEQNVSLYTTSIFALAMSPSHRKEAVSLLDLMDSRGIQPTSLTFVALIGAIDGPAATVEMMKRIDQYKKVPYMLEVFHSAIYACCRIPAGATSPERDWQTAISFFQQMRRKRIAPTTKTYAALMQVLSRTGQIKITLSLLRELQVTPGLRADDRVWGAAINVCAQAGDYREAIALINEMNESGYRANLRHCSTFLKALAKAGQEKLALQALEMMLGQNDTAISSGEEELQVFYLPPTPPDLVAVNTVMAACSKAGNFNATKVLFERLKAGEFIDPATDKPISPDGISYHTVLVSCRRPELARELVKEMRLSRRHRTGASPPTSVTYAHAISACQKAETPDVDSARLLLKWARDDAIEPTVFMYASAIWTAERSSNCAVALELFDEMKMFGCSPNAVAYDGVISAVSKQGNAAQAIALYEKMKSDGLKPTLVTYKCLASTIRKLKVIEEKEQMLEQILNSMDSEDRMIRVGGPIFEALISFFGEQRRFDDSSRVFEMIRGPIDGPCLRAMLFACCTTSPPKWEDAVSILHSSDIVIGTSGPGKMDQVALSNAIVACSKAEQFHEALNLLQLYGIPASQDSRRRPPSLSVVAINSLIAACGRGRRPDLALALLNDMESQFGLRPDTRSYRSAIIACNQAEHERRLRPRRGDAYSENAEEDDLEAMQWWECAISLLRRMRENGVKADIQTFSSAISSCEAAGEWQRALGVLQAMMDADDNEMEDGTALNLYCFNAAISACEKGGAWVEALELYERMIDQGGSLAPNFITLNSLIVALEKAQQRELAQSKYEEARQMQIVNPWRTTRKQNGERIYALDLHRFSKALASAAVRSVMDSYLHKKSPKDITEDLVIITGKGLRSSSQPVLMGTVVRLLEGRYGVKGRIDDSNKGRLILDVETLHHFLTTKSWR